MFRHTDIDLYTSELSDSESSEYVTDSDSDSDVDDITVDDVLRNHKFRWRNSKSPKGNTDFLVEPFSLPPDDFDEVSPYDFCQF